MRLLFIIGAFVAFAGIMVWALLGKQIERTLPTSGMLQRRMIACLKDKNLDEWEEALARNDPRGMARLESSQKCLFLPHGLLWQLKHQGFPNSVIELAWRDRKPGEPRPQEVAVRTELLRRASR